eukprot:TRINITY_DN8911_c0_g1_i1.p1 TRINITY_DN8911_c0_g1~~TRINITY_DN8911_c0_g1_i1.p1  ORF type:complete len:359 (-),score=119.56 TRINITY_DN8911_c0_g1_i1:290-1366(-)
MFAKLVAFEQEIDANLQRRRFELHEGLRRPATRAQKLRVWVYHTFTEQDQPEGDPAGWTLKVVGKLLPDEKNPYAPVKKFTSFVSSIQVHLTGAGPEQLVEWKKPDGFEEVDGLEIKRTGDVSLEAMMLLHLDFNPRRFKLSKELCDTLQLANQPETRPKVLEALWHYIKVMKLQDSTNTLQVNNDSKLKKLFGCDRMEVSQLFKKLDDHLSPLPPVQIKHTLRLVGNPAELDQCYDLDVTTNDVPNMDPERFFTRTQADNDRRNKIDHINDQIFAVANDIKAHLEKRQFYQSLHHAPVPFLNSLLATQAQEHKKAQQQKAGLLSERSQAPYYHQPWVPQAVSRYLLMRSSTEHGNQF